MTRKPYPSDVSDDEWAFVAPYLIFMTEDAPQRDYALREVFNGLRWLARSGAQWRMMPNDVPPWYTGYQQTQRWLQAQVFAAIVHDLRMLLRAVLERMPQPRAAIFDARTLQSSPESGERAGYDGHKRRKGSKVPIAVDTLGHLLAVLVTPALPHVRCNLDGRVASRIMSPNAHRTRERRVLHEVCNELSSEA
jgi:transposase